MKKSRKRNSEDIVERIVPVSKVRGGVTMSLYGRSGTGKTTLAGTFPVPSLILDIHDDGTDSISHRRGIDVLPVESWDDIEDVLWYFKGGKGLKRYKTLIIDTITQAQSVAIMEAKRQSGRDPEDPMSQRLWGEVGGLLSNKIIQFRNLSRNGLNVVFIAQDRTSKGDGEEDDQEQIIPSVGPALSPATAKTLNAAVKVIGQTFISEKHVKVKTGKGGTKLKTKLTYQLRIGPHPYYITKARVPNGLPEESFMIENPTYDKLMAILRGE